MARLSTDGTYQKWHELIDFLERKTRGTTVPISVCWLSREFIQETGSTDVPDTVNHRIYGIRTKIARMENFDKNTRVRMLFALSATLDFSFLEELRKNAIVNVDIQQRIMKYVAKDGSLMLDGCHRRGTKIHNRQKRKFSRTAEESSDEEIEEEEDESIKVKEDEEDTKEGIFKMKNLKGINGRLVKQPRLYINQLAESYSKMKRASEGGGGGGEYLLYDDTGEAQIAYLPNTQVQKEDVLDSSRRTVSAENASPKRQGFIDYIPEYFSHASAKNAPESSGSTSSRTIPESSSKRAVSTSVAQKKPSESAQRLSVLEHMRAIVPKRELVDISEVLKPLRNVIEIIDSPILANLQKRLDEKIAEFESKGHKIPNQLLLESFGSSLRLLSKHASPLIDYETSTRFKEYLLIFRMAIAHLTSKDFAEFQKWMKDASEDPRVIEKRISIEKIRLGLEYIVEYILP